MKNESTAKDAKYVNNGGRINHQDTKAPRKTPRGWGDLCYCAGGMTVRPEVEPYLLGRIGEATTKYTNYANAGRGGIHHRDTEAQRGRGKD